MKILRMLAVAGLLASAYAMHAGQQGQNSGNTGIVQGGVHHGAYTINDPRFTSPQPLAMKFGGSITKKSIQTFTKSHLMQALKNLPEKPTQAQIDAISNTLDDIKQALQALSTK